MLGTPSFAHSTRGLSDRVALAWTPPPQTSTWDWLCENGVNEKGERFNHIDYPWCRGVCDAFDSGQYIRIVLQWAARVGKTFLCQSLLLKTMATDPQFMMFGSVDELLTRRIMKTKFWRMLARGPMAEILPPEGKWSTERIELNGAILQAAWSGSDSRLADFGCAISHANEVSKWRDSEDGGDTLDQFLARSAEYPNRMNLVEGTPEREGVCRVERQRLLGTDCRFWVPCRSCGNYQVLTWGKQIHGEAGMFWDVLANGDSDPDLAYETAHYRCNCGAEHFDEHKAEMIRAGVWAPAGQWVNKKGKVCGNAKRPNARIWSSQLSSLYASNRRWGDLASLSITSRWQVFQNLYLGETYAAEGRTTTTDILGERLRTAAPRAVVPEMHSLCVLAVDVQKDSWPWSIVSAGPDGRRHVVDAGQEDSWSEVEGVMGTELSHIEGYKLFPAAVFVDSSDGSRTKEIYDWCASHSRRDRPVIPIKGSSHAMDAMYRESMLGKNQRSTAAKSHRGEMLLIINTDYWESDIDWRLFDGIPDDPEGLGLCHQLSLEAAYLKQLLNAMQVKKKDSRGNEKILWGKKDEHEPNDFRDVLKIGLCGIEWWLDRHRRRLPVLRRANQPLQTRGTHVPRFGTPDGRAFVAAHRR